MILEIESVYSDAILHGKTFNGDELRAIVKELLTHFDESEFVSIFCSRYDYEILPYDKDIPVDYIIDLDTHLVIKPKY